MELTVAYDFQNNIHQITIVSILIHLAGTLTEVDNYTPLTKIWKLSKKSYDIKSHW